METKKQKKENIVEKTSGVGPSAVPTPAPVEKIAPETPAAPTTPKLRRIIIETDGDNIRVVSAEVSGTIELIAILSEMVQFFRTKKQ